MLFRKCAAIAALGLFISGSAFSKTYDCHTRDGVIQAKYHISVELKETNIDIGEKLWFMKVDEKNMEQKVVAGIASMTTSYSKVSTARNWVIYNLDGYELAINNDGEQISLRSPLVRGPSLKCDEI